MATDWKQLFDDLSIPCWTQGKNCVEGCVSIRCPCPGCGDHSNHGHFNISTGRYSCWKCSGAPAGQVLAWAARLPVKSALEIIAKYSDGKTSPVARKRKSGGVTSIKLPGSTKCPVAHRRYLEGRGFDPQELEFYHGIQYTLMEHWEGVDASYRVIIPVHDLDGQVVAWQGRAISKEQELRYIFPPVEKCVMHYKHTLYGANACRKLKRIVVCEGVFDQWRLGPGSVCTFGTSLTREQVNLLANWEEIVFLFDPEETAQEHAREYARDLAALGRKVEVCAAEFGLDRDGNPRDPGDLTQQEAREVMQELGVAP